MSRWFLRRSMKVKMITLVLATFMVFAGVGAVMAANQKSSSVKGDYTIQRASPEAELMSQKQRIDANRTEIETSEEDVPFATTSTQDPSLAKDTTVVRVEGSNGKKIVKTEVRYRGGVEISRSLISETITVPAVNKVVAVGTKVVKKSQKPVEIPSCPALADNNENQPNNDFTTDCKPDPGDEEANQEESE